MLNALLSEANHGLVIGIIFTIVLALLVIETPRKRRAVSLRAELDSAEARTALEEEAVQRMIIRVKLALEAAKKERMVRVPLVPNQVSGLRHGVSEAVGEERSDPDQHLKQIAAFVEPPPARALHPMLRPLEVHRMLTRIGAAHSEALEDWK